MNAPAPTPEAPRVRGRCYALIPCAGVGERARSQGQPAWPKQYQDLAGRPVLAHTLSAFRALGDALSGLAVVLSPADGLFEQRLGQPTGVSLLRCGGATRADSVRAGLQAWMAQPGGPGPMDWVLVHDAARCLVTPALLEALIAACSEDAVGGLLALPLADTLKAAESGRVAHTLARSGKWLAQTPQMFRAGALLQALQHGHALGLEVTDEASALEAQGLQPLLVPGSAQNFKITYPEDFLLAEAVLQARGAAAAH